MKFAFLKELFLILIFFLIYFIWNDYFILFCLFLFYSHKKYKKKFLIKYFFIENVPINYLSLSKKCTKLSKSCPFVPKNPKKSEKNLKNPKNPDFYTFFLMVSSPLLSKVVSSFNVRKNQKNVRKKSQKKSDFHFCKLFF
jgi:hypothetical protein